MFGLDFSFVGDVLGAIWPFLVAGGSAVGALWLAKYFMAHPEHKFAIYYPLVLGAVRFGEKAIRDDHPNRGMARADAALKEFIRQYEAETGLEVSAAMKIWFNRMKELALLEVEKAKAAKVVTPPTPPVVTPPVV